MQTHTELSSLSSHCSNVWEGGTPLLSLVECLNGDALAGYIPSQSPVIFYI